MDPYQILGIPRNSTAQEIRSRYICLVKKYHPDKSDEDTIKKFQQIEYAYRTITNPESLKGFKPPKEDGSKNNVPRSDPPKPPDPPRKPKTKPTRDPVPDPDVKPMPKFKKGQNLDDFLNDLMKEGQKKTGKKKDKWS
jgi:curved DNA-binding protein CbpA